MATLITRMLRGAFNERPPVAKYSTFWEVVVVLSYLKGLGKNDTLSLRLLTVMLLALTRTARSVDLSKLDICVCSFTEAGVTNTCLSRVGYQSLWQTSFILDIQKIRQFSQ